LNESTDKSGAAEAPRNEEPGQPPAEQESRLSVVQVIGSVFAAGLGVHSSKNRERDFTQGRFGVFVAAGILFTLLFMGTLYAIVSLVLSNA
jgi:hypothetical protein